MPWRTSTNPCSDPALAARWLGRVSYGRALALQEEAVVARRAGKAPDTILFLEHPPVITLGRMSDRRHLLVPEVELALRGVEVHHCGRGGDVTFHGPGQLIGYPILSLAGDRRDAHRYLRDLEEALIRAVASYGVTAGRDPGLTGVWVEGRKLAAIGVRLSTGWITSHGFALNVATDLRGFDSIVPCGISDRGITSLAEHLSNPPPLLDVARVVARELAAVLGMRAEFEDTIVARDEALAAGGTG
jgi:lipoyl(octanoyl) transferase